MAAQINTNIRHGAEIVGALSRWSGQDVGIVQEMCELLESVRMGQCADALSVYRQDTQRRISSSFVLVA